MFVHRKIGSDRSVAKVALFDPKRTRQPKSVERATGTTAPCCARKSLTAGQEPLDVARNLGKRAQNLGGGALAFAATRTGPA